MNKSCPSLLRKQIINARTNIPALEQQQAANKLLQRFARCEKIQSGNRIGLYCATSGEIDTAALITYCWQQQKTVYLPVLHPFSSKHLLFISYQPGEALKPNRFGILEPYLNITKLIYADKLDVICTPLVAFDDSGNRMGMGQGYYDRLFAYHRTPMRLGLAYDFQQAVSLQPMAWDQPLDELLTPNQHWRFAAR